MGTVDLYRPTVGQVAQVIRARTKDDAMAELGTFTSDTRPTDEQVAGLILQAEGDVFAVVGQVEAVAPAISSLIVLRTCCLIELSYWPEQVRSDRSAYAEYKTLYDDSLASLLEVLAGDGSSSGGGVDDGTLHEPYGTVPVLSWTRSA